MKILVRIFIVIAGVLVLCLLTGLFVKKEYSVKKEVVINKPNAVVFDYIKLLKNQNDFSVWASIDPEMKKEFRGTDGTPGFVSAWESDNKHVGKGEQEIIKVVNGKKIDYELRFIKPFEAKNFASMSTDSIGDNQTRVIWEFSGKMKYPMNLMLVFMNMDKMVGSDFDKGLQNLKNILER